MSWAIAAVLATSLAAQTPVGGTSDPTFNFQPYQPPENCLPCHQRQYDELRSAVKAGYRNASPLQNSLEVSANFLNGGLLRPVYADSSIVLPDGTKLNTNMFTTPSFTELRQVQAGFCLSCHNPHIEKMGDDPSHRVFPALDGVGAAFQPELLRPQRDYMMVDPSGHQVLPSQIGGLPPAGAVRSLAGAGITCDVCHNMAGADLDRSFQQDGFANMSLLLNESMMKVGPFTFPVMPKGGFHVASNDPAKMSLLRSAAFCNSCHDVRVPLGDVGPGDVQHYEHDMNPGGENITYFRLENLSTEWQTGAYNSTTANPFGQVVRCQDCHMSQFPYAGDSTYQVGDMTVSSPTPAIFFQNYAAVPGVSTDANYPLYKRSVVNHHFTGVDVPLLYPNELSAYLDTGYPDPNAIGTDEYGIPLGLEARREDLLKAAVRINLDKTDKTFQIGQPFTVRAECVALTGHRFPAGFSQERTTYIQLQVTDDTGFVLYQSGYVVDKPHPETGELAPDGNMNDEDLEHIHAVVDPGEHADSYKTGPEGNGHTNQLFELGPDDGPDARIYAGVTEGLVLFRNELDRVYLPGQSLGRTDAAGQPIVAAKPHYEETFSAAFANTVDNYRSLRPLTPRTFLYTFTLPTQAELEEMGIGTLKPPLHIHAQVNYEHFPPLFVRFLVRTTGENGPAGHDMHLLSEQRLDDLLKNIQSITAADVKAGAQQ
jgi:hypothetical protein